MPMLAPRLRSSALIAAVLDFVALRRRECRRLWTSRGSAGGGGTSSRRHHPTRGSQAITAAPAAKISHRHGKARELAESKRTPAEIIDELMEAGTYLAFGPDTLVEAANRGYKPHATAAAPDAE